jgi:hypothetical protein
LIARGGVRSVGDEIRDGKSILISSELGRSIMDFVLLKVGRKTEVENFLHY